MALAQIDEAGFEVVLVLTQPDRPSGRGLKLHPSPVKVFAQSRGFPVAQPASLKLDGKHAPEAEAARQALIDARADVMVVAAYGLILPQWALDLPRHGCLNIHGSLLPRWRGAAPIHRAIEAGDRTTGVTIMQMDAGLDTGDMLLAERVPIADDETTGALHDRLAELGGRLIVEALEQLASGRLLHQPQPVAGVTYAHKITRAETVVDWREPAALIERRLRAFDPAPGASTGLEGEPLKLWRARVVESGAAMAEPGTVVAADAQGIVVACGAGLLQLTELQRAGGKRLPVSQFMQGSPPLLGRVLQAT